LSADSLQIAEPAKLDDIPVAAAGPEGHPWQPVSRSETVLAYLLLFAVMAGAAIAAILLGFLP
jgi:hypothetical protein